MARLDGAFDMTLIPTEVGERVAFMSWGVPVRNWMVGLTGTVVRFTRTGNPVVLLDDSPMGRAQGHDVPPMVTDRYGCARCVDGNGHWVRPQP